jgi:hypothetical protein
MIEASCDSCEAEFEVNLIEGPSRDTDADGADGIYCIFCSNYISLEGESDQGDLATT